MTAAAMRPWGEDIRADLIDCALRSENVAIRYRKDGRECAAVGRVIAVDFDIVKIVQGRSNDTWAVKLSQVDRVDVMENGRVTEKAPADG